MTPITAALLTHAGVHPNVAAVWAPALATQCTARGITTPLRVAAFLTTILHETNDLTVLVEDLDYAAEALLAQWPAHFTPAQAVTFGRTAAHAANQVQIAEHAYGGRMGNSLPGSGDGWLFRGHGPVQTTGRAAYAVLAKEVGQPIGALPAWLLSPAGGAEAAARYWQDRGCNGPADRGDIARVRLLINGGTIGLADVTARYAAWMGWLGTPAARALHAGSGTAARMPPSDTTDVLNAESAAGTLTINDGA